MCNSAKKIQNESCKRRRALLRAVGTWLAMSDGEPPRWHPGSLASITCHFPFLSTCAIRSVSYPPQKSDLATLKPCPASGRPNFHSTPRVCVCVRVRVCVCTHLPQKDQSFTDLPISHARTHTHTHRHTCPSNTLTCRRRHTHRALQTPMHQGRGGIQRGRDQARGLA